MSLFSKLFQAIGSWRHRRDPHPTRRAGVRVEQLDHRQLLSVNFTGNVTTDFPATQSPGVVVLQPPSGSFQATPPPSLQTLIPVSGFNISDIRVSYDSSNDTLYFGLDQPASQLPGQGEVIAGDQDDNGNSATVNPAVLAIDPFFTDDADMQGTKYMGVVLGFNGPNNPQIVAGFSEVSPIGNTPTNPSPNLTPKPYEVATTTSNLPVFGTWLTQYTGSVFLQNAPSSPNLEFSITHFSQLYQQETGTPLTSSSVIYVGAQGGSAAPDFISDTSILEQPMSIASATLPVTSTCPPQSPTVYVNPHEHRIIDTLHRDLIRVTIEGTSGFKVKDINPSTVRLNGVPAIADIVRKTQRDQFPFATYVFVADQLNLPAGLDNVTVSGTLKNGVTQFSSTTTVLNIPDSASKVFGRLHRYMGGGTIYHALSKIEARHPNTVPIASSSATTVSVSRNPAASGVAKLKVSYAPVLSASTAKSSAKAARAETPRQVISIQRADKDAETSTKLPTMLRHSLSEHLDRLDSAGSAA
ncbi:MAG: hypothetical protein ACLQGP_11480 [Isosphaeraceae bacterium]